MFSCFVGLGILSLKNGFHQAIARTILRIHPHMTQNLQVAGHANVCNQHKNAPISEILLLDWPRLGSKIYASGATGTIIFSSGTG